MRSVIILCFSVLLSFKGYTQDKFPQLNGFVTDKTNFLNSSEINSLEADLRAFEQETSNEIVVYITDDLYGYDKSEYAYEVAEKNGIGKNEDDNGVFILIKPKTALNKGEIFIATGYGLEGAIPDAICNQIIDQEILPEFKNGRYFLGIKKGVDVLKQLAKGEINKEQYKASKKKNSKLPLLVIIILFFIIFNLFRARRARKYSTLNGVPFWTAWSLMSFAGGSSRSNSFSNFSSGSGGFGGFGGGSFGGGGAGGSW